MKQQLKTFKKNEFDEATMFGKMVDGKLKTDLKIVEKANKGMDNDQLMMDDSYTITCPIIYPLDIIQDGSFLCNELLDFYLQGAVTGFTYNMKVPGYENYDVVTIERVNDRFHLVFEHIDTIFPYLESRIELARNQYILNTLWQHIDDLSQLAFLVQRDKNSSHFKLYEGWVKFTPMTIIDATSEHKKPSEGNFTSIQFNPTLIKDTDFYEPDLQLCKRMMETYIQMTDLTDLVKIVNYKPDYFDICRQQFHTSQCVIFINPTKHIVTNHETIYQMALDILQSRVEMILNQNKCQHQLKMPYVKRIYHGNTN